MKGKGVLIIDDEPQMLKLLQICLESNEYHVIKSATAKEGIVYAATIPHDLMILDLGLPDLSGHLVLKQLREWYTKPIIILSVINNEVDIVRALDNGATDYLTKPFRTGELLARIRAAIRRSTTQPNQTIISTGNLSVDLIARTVKKDGELVKLTSTEYSMLALFAKNEGMVLTHQFILKEVWGFQFQSETQYLRVYVGQLRKKLEDNPNHPKHIITESGVGYRFQ